MNPEELKTELARIAKEAEEIKSALQNTPKADEIATLKTALAEAEKKMGDYQEMVNKLADKVEKGSQKTDIAPKTLAAALEDAFAANKDALDTIIKSDGKHGAVSFEVSTKAVIDMGVQNTIGSTNPHITISENTGIVSQIRKRVLTYLSRVSTGRIGTDRAVWVEEEDEQGNPIFIGEGDAKTQLSVKYVEKEAKVKKIAVYGKVTTEMLADLPQLISYIQTNLMRRMDLKVEDGLIAGDGLSNNLKGIEEYATAFAAPTGLAAAVVNANELDVLEAVALQVKLAHGSANTIFVNPSTVAKIKLIKDADGNPVWKNYVTIDGSLVISGMQVVETTAITAGEFVGGDTSVVQVRFRDEIGITIGLDGNDFTENKKTMLLEQRLVQFVSANDTQLLVKGDFASAITALDKP